jgi:ferredoxin
MVKKVYSIYFSPTGTTEKVANAMAAGTGLLHEKADLTTQKKRRTFRRSFDKDDLVIVGAPVYGGRIPGNLDDLFSGLNGNSASAIALVVYGNREYEDALIEMKIRLEERGFQVIAGAAFIGEHTFSTKIATGRPSEDDLVTAREFGKKIAQFDISNTRKLTVKGNYPYTARGFYPDPTKMGPAAAASIVTTNEDCTFCGVCAEECPWGVITIGDSVTIDYSRCFRCLRCVRVCPAGALAIRNPEFYTAIAKFEEFLKGRYKEPEMFLAE